MNTRDVLLAALGRDLPSLIDQTKKIAPEQPSTMKYMENKKEWVAAELAYMCQYDIPLLSEANEIGGFEAILKLVHRKDIQNELLRVVQNEWVSLKYKIVIMYFMSGASLEQLDSSPGPDDIKELLDFLFALSQT